MKLGLALPHYDTSLAGQPVSWEGVSRIARTAERVGFDSLWVSDHFFLDWSKYGGPDTVQGTFECWTLTSALAAITDRVRVGSMVACNDFRPPALVAKMVASLDELSGGRVDLGLGAGWYEPEYRAAGIEFHNARTRIARLEEAVEIIGRLLDGEELVFKGDHYTIDGAIVRPLGPRSPRPPIWVGGKGDRTLGAIARKADGWNFSWMGPFSTYEERAAAADKACEEADRDPRTLRRSVGVYMLAGTSEADVRRRFERLVERTPPGILRSGGGATGVSWDEFKQDRVAGTVDEVVDRLSRLAELGVEEVVAGLGAIPFQLADEEDVELFGSEIAPALRELNGGTS
ncbi:MAG TPA: LLM class flavin-dependent oxidoreductase [Actinomycetota bacterium]|nr:LLM class flavin-dependent oxidoreductase [Actinomycetota bacterium]